MTRGQKKRILTPGEVLDIKGMKAEATEQIRQMGVGIGTPSDNLNKARLQKQINYYERLIDEGKAPKVAVGDRDRLAAEAKGLKDKVTAAMLTRYQMDHPSKNPGVIQKQVRFMQVYKKDIQRYKEIQRVLEPNDPTAVDLEQFRREK